MNFSDTLNNYIKLLNCSSKELADSSKLSTAVISRYRCSKRIPVYGSEPIIKLADGICKLAISKNLANFNNNEILHKLNESINVDNIDFQQFSTNFNYLISVLKINLTEMSRALNFDASYVSRIHTGQRKPSNPKEFANDVSKFIVRKYSNTDNKSIVANLINCDISSIENNLDYSLKLSNWLCCGSVNNTTNVDDFLKKLNDFNLNEYIRAIHFDEIKIPTIPFRIPTSKHYYGIEEMKNAELDFFKSTVLSKSTESIFMYNSMPMENMSKDVEFGKKWMFAIAASLKKGLNLNIIHNLNRPFNELLIGLELWIPIYMTGQVNPYYLPNAQNNLFNHINYVSGNVALTGECVQDFQNKGRYYLSNNKEEVAYYKKTADCILSVAKPLIQIYDKKSKNAYDSFLLSDSQIHGERHNILSSPPIYTLSEELLLKILKRYSLSDTEINTVLDFWSNQKQLTNTILSHSNILDELTELSFDEFKKYPVALSLSGIFFEQDIIYTCDEYLEHLKLCKEFANNNSNYTIKPNNSNAFRNIQIFTNAKKWVMLSKNNNPAIHFVIRHSKLRKAIENFIVPIIE